MADRNALAGRGLARQDGTAGRWPPVERAHNLTIRACEIGGRWRHTRRLAERVFTLEDARLATHAMGLDFVNPVGLAAGFDKNGRAVSILGSLGFGHVELGSGSAH